jgi:hypothetical protein
MRIIKEEDANAVATEGVVLALSETLYSKQRAETIAQDKRNGGEPLLCEYVEQSKTTGRSVKRYLPLALHRWGVAIPMPVQGKCFKKGK